MTNLINLYIISLISILNYYVEFYESYFVIKLLFIAKEAILHKRESKAPLIPLRLITDYKFNFVILIVNIPYILRSLVRGLTMFCFDIFNLKLLLIILAVIPALHLKRLQHRSVINDRRVTLTPEYILLFFSISRVERKPLLKFMYYFMFHYMFLRTLFLKLYFGFINWVWFFFFFFFGYIFFFLLFRKILFWFIVHSKRIYLELGIMNFDLV